MVGSNKEGMDGFPGKAPRRREKARVNLGGITCCAWGTGECGTGQSCLRFLKSSVKSKRHATLHAYKRLPTQFDRNIIWD